MRKTEIHPEELAGYSICANCIGDDFLRTKVVQDGIQGNCTYCHETGQCISVGDLADRLEAAIDDHFQLTSTEPDGFEWLMLSDKEESYNWERHGQPVADLISEIAELPTLPSEHVRQILEDRHFDIHAAAAWEENPYDVEAHYEEKDVNDYELQEGWNYFQTSLKTETRIFNRQAESVLDSIFEDLHEHLTLESNPVIVDVGPACRIAKLYRARVFQSDDALENALKRPDLGIGPPPFAAAIAGRMNARGISLFYGATTPEVALAEVRPPVGSRVVVGEFDVIKRLRLLDVEALRQIYVDGSIFDSSYIRKLEKARFFRRLSHQITMPVMPDDEPGDYLVTQAIADYLADRMKPQLDGIIYRSIQTGKDGINTVLFHKSSRVEKLSIPEGTVIRASLLSWSEDGSEPDYDVWEEVPDEQERDDEKAGNFAFLPDEKTRDNDVRPPTLRLNVERLIVHYIERIQLDTTTYPVDRHRVPKREHDF